MAVFILPPSHATYITEEYHFEFGEMHKGNDSLFRVTKQSKKIPLITEGKYVFGFVLKRLNSKPFNCQLKIKLPGKTQKQEGISKNINVDKNNMLVLPSKVCEGEWRSVMWFNEGDPAGIWRLYLYIDGTQYKEFDFEVYEKE